MGLDLETREFPFEEAKFQELKKQSQKQQFEDEFNRMLGKKTEKPQVEQSKSGKNLLANYYRILLIHRLEQVISLCALRIN
jgi:hypothetical protein